MNVKATRTIDQERFFQDGQPGLFLWRGDPPGRLMFYCPCGCGDICGITVKPVELNGWEWDGNLESPTCKPSILINRGHWHGYLTNGEFVSC